MTRASSCVGRCKETAELSREIGRKWPSGGICGSAAIGIEWHGWQKWEKSLISGESRELESYLKQILCAF